MPEPKSPYKRVRRHFSRDTLKRVCEMHETEFGEAYDMETWTIPSRETNNFYYYKDNGSNILAVAHLDTVIEHGRRMANFVNTAAGPIVFSGALDDRLGAYTILELLPKLGIQYDILLTVGEESGQSTAKFFQPPEGKEYNWMIEFDRGGTDCVMYQYEDLDLRRRVSESGAKPASGIFSDISYMEHLEIKGVNWGVGYRDYHGPRGHAYLEDYWMMIGHYLKFHDANKDEYLPHDKDAPRYSSHWSSGARGQGYGSGIWAGWGGDDDESWRRPGTGKGVEDFELADEEIDLDALTDEEMAADLEDLDLHFDEDGNLIEPEDADDIVSDDFNTVKDAMKELEAGPSSDVRDPFLRSIN